MKLIYFNLRGRAELARLILVEAKEDFEDSRIEWESSEWAALKDSMPMGQLPVLEVDSKQISQSLSIGRFLANKFHLAGTTPVEKFQADMIVECCKEFYDLIVGPMVRQNLKEVAEQLQGEKFDIFQKSMTRLLKENGDDFIVGKRVTWADLAIADLIGLISEYDQDVMSKAPELAELTNRVNALPRIKKWIEERPKTFI